MCILFIYWTVLTCFKGILGHFFSYRSCDPVQKKLEESIPFCVLFCGCSNLWYLLGNSQTPSLSPKAAVALLTTCTVAGLSQCLTNVFNLSFVCLRQRFLCVGETRSVDQGGLEFSFPAFASPGLGLKA